MLKVNKRQGSSDIAMFAHVTLILIYFLFPIFKYEITYNIEWFGIEVSFPV
ncbi:MAG: hypothetical protein L0213_03965 [Candidatus Dadabacteria bacterium]|nr:hypothetical protein [Candidatus Dadabacteria bacterium]